MFPIGTTLGLSPVTVTVSSSPPTRISEFTEATKLPSSSIPSRLTVANPGRVKVTTYMRGRRCSIRYWPLLSETTVRTVSSRAGLAASTVTPGSTAPDVSRTTPVIDAWAYAIVGRTTIDASRVNVSRTRRNMVTSAR